MVPSPAPVPDMPATEPTARVWKRSAGSEMAIVDIAAYEKGATAKHGGSSGKLEGKAAATSAGPPMPPPTITTLRARPTGQPRLMSALDTPPPKKVPRYDARTRTHTHA